MLELGIRQPRPPGQGKLMVKGVYVHVPGQQARAVQAREVLAGLRIPDPRTGGW